MENKSQQELFTQQWNIYQNVIRNNYMYHIEIIDIVSNEIEKFASLSILDLGCGDSFVISQSIKKIHDKDKEAGSHYFCESLFWASQPKQAAKT